VLIDIDHLREINDRLGHTAGDRVLGEMGAILQRDLRAPDFVERMRQIFARHTFGDLGPANAPGISAGVVGYPHSEALRPEDLFTLAESALQKAKSGAPDRIGVVGE